MIALLQRVLQASVTVDGKTIEGNTVTPIGDGKEHEVRVVMG